MEKPMMRLILNVFFLNVLLVPSAAYPFAEDRKTLNFTQTMEDEIRSKFGDCPAYFRDSCEGMLHFICNRDRQDHSVDRRGYYLDGELNPVAPSCNGWDQKNCQEPPEWSICKKVDHYRGSMASPLTLAEIKAKFGSNCDITSTCEDMLQVDCGAAADGPAYLLDNALKILAPSGGQCMRGCSGYEDQWKRWGDCTQRANENVRKQLESGGDVPAFSIMSKF